MSGREEDKGGVLDYGDVLDAATFEQILEMDDDDERDFSRSIVFGFFDQAEQTFVDIEEALEKKDMKQLSSLGHFLKGSSATLGMTKVQKGCEKIQHYGAYQNDAGDASDETEEQQLKKIKKVLLQVREDYKDAEQRLRKFYDE